MTSLPEAIGRLNSLEKVFLHDNALVRIPEEVIDRIQSSKEVYLHGNALGIPPEILGPSLIEVANPENRRLSDNERKKPQNPERIAKYLRQIQGGQVPKLNEAKLLVVGPGGAGKSSIIEKLVYKTFTPDTKDSTRGVIVTHWNEELKSKEGESIRLNVWDFGGQEIQHSLHEFFMSERAVYLLVINPREDQSAQATLYYWLDLIQLVAPDARIIVVLSRQDQGEGHVNDAENLRNNIPS